VRQKIDGQSGRKKERKSRANLTIMRKMVQKRDDEGRSLQLRGLLRENLRNHYVTPLPIYLGRKLRKKSNNKKEGERKEERVRIVKRRGWVLWISSRG